MLWPHFFLRQFTARAYHRSETGRFLRRPGRSRATGRGLVETNCFMEENGTTCHEIAFGVGPHTMPTQGSVHEEQRSFRSKETKQNGEHPKKFSFCGAAKKEQFPLEHDQSTKDKYAPRTHGKQCSFVLFLLLINCSPRWYPLAGYAVCLTHDPTRFL